MAGPAGQVGGRRPAIVDRRRIGADGEQPVDQLRVAVLRRSLKRRPATSLPDVRIGSHVVRLELSEHQAWTASTRVSAGQESRVTGSLERLQ